MMFVVAIVAALGATAIGVDIKTVPLGNIENGADTTGFGRVDYTYNVGKSEVINAQYCELLNAVADADPNGLYGTDIGAGWNDISGISRSGSSATCTCSVRASCANRPVNYVGWYDCVRFVNLLHNGQATGAEGPGEAGGAGCRDYPTAELPVGPDLVDGSANYRCGGYLDTTYYTGEVGACTPKPSESAYATFDRGGNIWRWNEVLLVDSLIEPYE